MSRGVLIGVLMVYIYVLYHMLGLDLYVRVRRLDMILYKG